MMGMRNMAGSSLEVASIRNMNQRSSEENLRYKG